MARPLRLEYLGAWYHVTGRGNERRAIYRDGRDRERFVRLLGELERRFGLEVHGYVLMNNHYHLLVRLNRETGLSAAMQWLGVSYTMWFNRRHQRVGHLFQGRFKAILVDFEEWGCALSRYIHLNPVRIRRHGLDKLAVAADRRGLGEKPAPEVVRQRVAALKSYLWSSYRSYLGVQRTPAWLHPEEVLSRFGRGARGRKEYRRYVEEAIRAGYAESPWEEVKAGLVLGGEELLERVRERISGDPREQVGMGELTSKVRLEGVVELVCRLKGERWEDFCNRRGDWGRDLALMAARRHTGLTNRELGQWLGGLDDSTVAQAVRRLEKRMAGNAGIRKLYEKLEHELSNAKM
jgi:REP element-mobilizing transposase RayT